MYEPLTRMRQRLPFKHPVRQQSRDVLTVVLTLVIVAAALLFTYLGG